MKPQYWYLCILWSFFHVIYSDDDVRVEKKATEKMCNDGDPVEGFCYETVYEPRQWSDAASDCRERGGQLAKTNTRQSGYHALGLRMGEAGALLVMVKAASYFNAPSVFWVGARERDGEYYWTDDTPLDPWGGFGDTLTNVKDNIWRWFQGKTAPPCVVLQREHDIMPLAPTIEVTMERKDCLNFYPYICQYDYIPMTLSTVEDQTTDLPAAVSKTGPIPLKTTAEEEQTTDLPAATIKTDHGPMNTAAVGDQTTYLPSAASKAELSRTVFSLLKNATVESQTTHMPPAAFTPDHISMKIPASEDRTILPQAASKTDNLSRAWGQYVFKGIKRMGGVFSPKLRENPDRLLPDTEKIMCLRICLQEKCCELVSHFPPGHCGLYCDLIRAKSKGADSILGSGIWVPLRR